MDAETLENAVPEEVGEIPAYTGVEEGDDGGIEAPEIEVAEPPAPDPADTARHLQNEAEKWERLHGKAEARADEAERRYQAMVSGMQANPDIAQAFAERLQGKSAPQPAEDVSKRVTADPLGAIAGHDTRLAQVERAMQALAQERVAIQQQSTVQQMDSFIEATLKEAQFAPSPRTVRALRRDVLGEVAEMNARGQYIRDDNEIKTLVLEAASDLAKAPRRPGGPPSTTKGGAPARTGPKVDYTDDEALSGLLGDLIQSGGGL